MSTISDGRLFRLGWVPLALILFTGACAPGTLPTDGELNPFQDLAPIPIDGQPHLLPATIAPLGPFAVDQVLSLNVSGDGIDAVLILAEDPESDASGRIAGGGLANETTNYRIQEASRYFVYVQFNPSAPESTRRATLTAAFGDPAYRPPAIQVVRIVFQPGYLTEPGLVDPDSFTADERAVLESISALVQAEITARLRTIFEDTPVQIVTETDPLPTAPFSTLTFSPERMPLESGAFFDAAIPAVDQDSPCLQPVIFGELLPRGTEVDPGNHVRDDSAIVYVGSFQGRGAECRSAAISSVNTIVLALAHTGAHEIGHLVGLYHTALVDIMDRRPTLAFQRELVLTRSQILQEIPISNAAGQLQPEPRVLTNIIQDPAFYFRTNF